jgi:hypothetical protein
MTTIEMSSTKRRSNFAVFLVLLFVLAFVPRVLYPVSRPMQWYVRSVRFWEALDSGDLAGTYQRYHPGVSTMWIAGLGLRMYARVAGLSSGDLLVPPVGESGIRYFPIVAGVAPLAAAISLCICLSTHLVSRLMGRRTGLLTGALLALDPYYLANSKVLHVDAVLATFMLVSVLFLLVYLESWRRRDLCLSGAAAGLSFLTKSPSAFLVPFAIAAVSFGQISETRSAAADGDRPRRDCSLLGAVMRDVAVWCVAAAAVFVAVWPAMWVEPMETITKIVQNAFFHADVPHDNPGFFWGRIVDGDLGFLFYPATIAWKSTLITLPGAVLALVYIGRDLLAKGRRSGPGAGIAAYFLGGVLFMSLAARKEMRYLLPAFPALDVLAAYGLVTLAKALRRGTRGRWGPRLETGAIAVVMIVQTITVIRCHPYYGTYYNELLGGSQTARDVLPLAEQEEGLDLAGQFLASFPRAETTRVGVQKRGADLFGRNYVGLARPIDEPGVDYLVFGVNSVQRRLGGDLWDGLWEQCSEHQPVWSASFGGVPYVWVCTNPPFEIRHRLDVRLGDGVTLAGYDVDREGEPDAELLSVELFWHTDQTIDADLHVFVHLTNEQGELVGQHDGVTAGGERPTWSWWPDETVRDSHLVPITDAFEPGTYEVSTGMYDYGTGQRLAVFGRDGERLPEDRVILEIIRVRDEDHTIEVSWGDSLSS